MSGKTKWVIAWTHWRAEQRARSGLEDKGYEVLIPTKTVETKHAGRKLLVERPIFPRYVFVGLPSTGSWYPILSTVAVTGLIQNGGKPVQVPEWIMLNLLGAQRAGAFNEKVNVAPFVEDQPVRFVGGPFANFAGKILTATPGRRVQVLIDMFGHKKEVSAPIELLRAA